MIRRDKWWVREFERVQRQHAYQIAELLSVVAHLAGRPLPPPEASPRGVGEPERELLYAAPEQYPEEMWEP